MKIAFLASEVLPFAKTGGLADVAGALPKYLGRRGSDVHVLLPYYREVSRKAPAPSGSLTFRMDWLGRSQTFTSVEHRADGFTAHFIVNDDYFDREHLYATPDGDYPDNGERFAFFAKASLAVLKALDVRPDILHVHDWQAAIALAYLRFVFSGDPAFAETRTLFTIHNLAYQGQFPREILGRIGLPDGLFNMHDLEFYGKVNFLKAGIVYSDAVSTVSPRYSREIQTPEFGCGLDGLLKFKSDRLFGLLNGVDYAAWDPAVDKLIAAPFTPQDLTGKSKCKSALPLLIGLPPEAAASPVVGMVTRLAGQKGLDIVVEALEGLFELDIVLVILGTGESKIQAALADAQRRRPRQLGLKVAFDERVAHAIYAGSDMFLIPSRYEPCGLTQMYSLKYGTIPIVRATGGLDDSISEFDRAAGTGTGFKFEAAAAEDLVAAVKRAIIVFSKRDLWRRLVQNAMAEDFSWERAAGEYLKLYETVRAF